ncbi:UNVERIFIED_CONTAM: hypothetical protein GTU68_016438 [Idotea baltica]|nr:hypothetical protein [Idotea baltica]
MSFSSMGSLFLRKRGSISSQ